VSECVCVCVCVCVGIVRPGVRAALAHELKKNPKEDGGKEGSLATSCKEHSGYSSSALRLLSLSLLVQTLSLEPGYNGEYLVSTKTLSKGLHGNHAYVAYVVFKDLRL
jgi:hypothetical protein